MIVDQREKTFNPFDTSSKIVNDNWSSIVDILSGVY